MKKFINFCYEHALIRPVVILVIYLAVYFAGRVILLVQYPDDFKILSQTEIVQAFVRGMMFDNAIILTFIGIPLLLMWLPFKLTQHKWVQLFWNIFFYVVLLIMAFILVGDIIYYGHIHRHAGQELAIALQNDKDLLIAMAIGSYSFHILLFLVFSVVLFAGWKHIWRIEHKQTDKYWSRLFGAFVGLIVIILAVRGGLAGKPLNIINAYASGSVAAGNLTLNGPYAIFHTLRSRGDDYASQYYNDEALKKVKEYVHSDKEIFPNKINYPLYRMLESPDLNAVKKPNIVIIMMESLDAVFIDHYRETRGLQPLGVTPNISRLSKDGLLLTNFFANGQRSIHGLTALLTGVPALPHRSTIDQGMAQSRLSYLGVMAKSQGYETVFLQSSKGHSFRIDSIAALAGFDYYAGSEKIPLTGHIEFKNGKWEGWDYDMLVEADRLFSQQTKPFMGFLFTSATHLPFIFPGEQWRKYAGDTQQEKYLNTLSYADWSVGEFIKLAKEKGYYDNTVFVIVGDHVSGQNKASTLDAQHRVGFVMFGKGVKPNVVDTVASQVDLMPSLVDFLGWEVGYASIGRSFFNTDYKVDASALLVEGGIVAAINRDTWLRHSMKMKLESFDSEKTDHLEDLLLSKVGVVNHLLDSNEILPLTNNIGLIKQ
ncbi:MAG: sulfatase-like hydrolase/transferase [Gammaproteobacteria bacterium]|nr:sulfatase-like hydrolase/transferase [Gammaproteobacteria bacterium]